MFKFKENGEKSRTYCKKLMKPIANGLNIWIKKTNSFPSERVEVTKILIKINNSLAKYNQKIVKQFS